MGGVKVYDLDKGNDGHFSARLSDKHKNLLVRRWKADIVRGSMSEKNFDILNSCINYEDVCECKKGVVEVGLAPCLHCGSTDFIRTGTCYTCTQCSETTGCS